VTDEAQQGDELWEAHARWWQDGFTEGADPEYEEQILPMAAQHLRGATRVLDVGCGERPGARSASPAACWSTSATSRIRTDAALAARIGDPYMTHASSTRAAVRMILAGLLATSAACTLKEQEAPPLTGPSEFAQSITVSVSPDILSQDGASQSVITVTAKGPTGEPLRNVSLRNEIVVAGTAVDFGSLSARNVVTGADGRATFVYTAPRAPAVAVDEFTIVEIMVWPQGSDFNNTTPRTAAIRLVPPGAVIPPDALRPSFTTSPQAPLDNQDVLFDATASQPSGGIVRYSWNFGDGRSGSGRTATHKYDEPGTYFPTLTIEDQFGRTASATSTITIGSGNNPTATFVVSPSAPRVNTSVNFNASGSVAATGRQIVSYRWDFGDGTPLVTASGPTVSHTYTAAQTYTVTLVVTDNTGKSATVSLTVTIAP
jgi:PKD repeat protein